METGLHHLHFECESLDLYGHEILTDAQRLPSGSFSHCEPGRHPLCFAQVPGTMQTCRPVVCSRKIEWSGISAELPDAGLDELDRMRVVRFDGAFDALRLATPLPLVDSGV